MWAEVCSRAGRGYLLGEEWFRLLLQLGPRLAHGGRAVVWMSLQQELTKGRLLTAGRTTASSAWDETGDLPRVCRGGSGFEGRTGADNLPIIKS